MYVAEKRHPILTLAHLETRTTLARFTTGTNLGFSNCGMFMARETSVLSRSNVFAATFQGIRVILTRPASLWMLLFSRYLACFYEAMIRD